MSKKINCWKLFFLLFFVMINACDNYDSEKTTRALVGLTLGIQPDGAELTELVLLAKALKLFNKNGLHITYKDYHTGGLALSALENKEVDLAVTGEYIFLKNLLKGSDIRIIASIATSNPIRVVAHKGIGIKTPADLKERRIALISESSSEFDLGIFLLYYGIKIDAVKILKLPTPVAVHEAFVTDTVDAAILWEPYITKIKNKLENQIYEWSPHSGKQLFWLVSAQERFVRLYPDKVNQFLTAVREAEVFLETNPDIAREAIYNQSKHTQDHFDYMFSIVESELILDQSLLIALEDQARWLISNRQVNHDKMPNLLRYFYFNGMQQVKPEGVHIVH